MAMRNRSCFKLSLGMVLVLASVTTSTQGAAPAPPPAESPPPAPPAERPAVKPPTIVREFDSGKFHIGVDRKTQKLHIESPKPIDWLEANVAANQTVEVIRGGAALQRGRDR